MIVVERSKNIPVKSLRDDVFTEENLKNGISVSFVGSNERFDFILRNGFNKKKIDKLIGNLRRARQASGLPEMQIMF